MKNISFTIKETHVAIGLVSGMSAKMISQTLRMPLRTVEYYQKKIKEKLNSKNAYQTGYAIGVFFNLMESSITLEGFPEYS